MIRPTKLGKGGFGGEGFDDDMEVFQLVFKLSPDCCHNQDDEFVTIVLSSQNPISSANHVR